MADEFLQQRPQSQEVKKYTLILQLRQRDAH